MCIQDINNKMSFFFEVSHLNLSPTSKRIQDSESIKYLGQDVQELKDDKRDKKTVAI